MKRVIWHITARWYEARAYRAMRKYLALKSQSEKFFARLGDGK